MAPVPVGREAGSPFGGSIQALATYLRYHHARSYARVAALLAEGLGLRLSEGGLSNLFQSVKARLEQQGDEILKRLRRRRRVGSDETSARVNGQNQWDWVFETAEVCGHLLRPSRGQDVIQEALGAPRPRLWVSDLFSAQRHHRAEQWQVCLAHPLRDCQFAIEAGDAGFAPVRKALLRRSFVSHKRPDQLSDSTLYQCRGALKRRLQRCLLLQPTPKHGLRLKKRYAKIADNLFLFLGAAAIPPTHHSSEQAIRLSLIFRKVPKGLRSAWGRALFAAVRSVVNPGKRKGLSAYQASPKALFPIGSLFEPG